MAKETKGNNEKKVQEKIVFPRVPEKDLTKLNEHKMPPPKNDKKE